MSSPTVCKFYSSNGKCKFGTNCRFLHPENHSAINERSTNSLAAVNIKQDLTNIERSHDNTAANPKQSIIQDQNDYCSKESQNSIK